MLQMCYLGVLIFWLPVSVNCVLSDFLCFNLHSFIVFIYYVISLSVLVHRETLATCGQELTERNIYVVLYSFRCTKSF